MKKSPRLIKRLSVVSAVMAVLALSACGGGSDDTTSSSGSVPDSIDIAMEQSMTTMDFLVSNSAPINQMIGAALTRVSVDGPVEADLAESYESNEDGSVWTYKLRSDLEFSDGSPLTVDDVVFTYETILNNPESLLNTYIAPLKSIKATDDSTIVMTLNAPNATWPRQTTQFDIAPAASYDPKTFATEPIGAGPYNVVDFNGTDTMTLEANENYQGSPKPVIKKAVIHRVGDQTTRLSGLQSGQFDAALLSGNNVDVAKSAGLEEQEVTGSKVIYLGYNVTSPGLDLLKLRQAISLAIDRQAMVDTLLSGYGTPTDQMVSSSTFGYDANAETPEQDVDAAKALVEESGYDGTPIVLQYPATAYVPTPPETAQAVANYLKDVGINVKLESVADETFLTDWATAKLSAGWLFSAQTVTLDGSGTFNYVDVLLSTADDPKTVELYNKQLGEADPDARLAVIAEMNAYRNEMAYYTPLFVDNFVYVYSDEFSLPTPPANGYPNPQFFQAG